MLISIGLPPNLVLKEYVQLAGMVERYDFESIFLDDIPHFKSCWAILHTLAAHTQKVKLGASVTHPFFRHPLCTASELAVLDEISEGRAVLGIGRGDREYYDSVGLHPENQVRAVKEAVEVIRYLLSGKREGYRGKVFTIKEGLTLAFTPNRSSLPVYIGTTGPKMFQVAGEVADGVQSAGLCSTSYVAVAAENVRIGANRAGRHPKEIRIGADIWTCLSDDRAAAEGLLKPLLANRIPKLASMMASLGIDPQEVRAIEEAEARGDLRAAASFVSDNMMGTLAIWGTAQDAVIRIKELERAGVQHINLKKPLGPDLPQAIRIIGEEVIPRVR